MGVPETENMQIFFIIWPFFLFFSFFFFFYFGFTACQDYFTHFERS